MSEWICWQPSLGETEAEGRTIRADDAEQAAERFGRWGDEESADYNILKGRDAVVLVRRPPFGTIYTYIVSAETVPMYYARLVAPTPGAVGPATNAPTLSEGGQVSEVSERCNKPESPRTGGGHDETKTGGER